MLNERGPRPSSVAVVLPYPSIGYMILRSCKDSNLQHVTGAALTCGLRFEVKNSDLARRSQVLLLVFSQR